MTWKDETKSKRSPCVIVSRDSFVSGVLTYSLTSKKQQPGSRACREMAAEASKSRAGSMSKNQMVQVDGFSFRQHQGYLAIQSTKARYDCHWLPLACLRGLVVSI